MTDLTTLPAGVPTDLWIGGRQTPSSSGARFGVVDPASGRELTTVADATAADGLLALGAAAQTQPAWSATPPRERANILYRAYELVVDRADEFALLMTLEMGKPLRESLSEVTYGAEFLRWFAEEAVRINGRFTSTPTGAGHILVTKEPVGPVLAITPWNFPLAMGTRKIGPALAAGCTIVVKPAEDTPLTMLLLARTFHDAGLPAGVLSVLPTSDAPGLTGPLLDDPRLRKVTFTGSTEVGKQLVRNASNRLLRTSMELGGNAPFIVFGDADVDLAVHAAMAAKMRNGGQACTAANRFYVANEIKEEFTSKLTAKIAGLTVGAGLDDRVDVGPLINGRQLHAVTALVEDAVARGARVRTGGRALDCSGYFFAPTVLDQIPVDADLWSQEIFGPIAPVTGFDTEDEAITTANATQFGLAAYFFTQDINRVKRVAAALDTGMVAVNRGVLSDAAAPFGGIKESGFGREGGAEGIGEYLRIKYTAL